MSGENKAAAQVRAGKQPIYLPISRFLDTAAFGRMLDQTTTSYKFLWCGAILDFVQDEVSRRQGRGLLAGNGEIRIPIRRLVAEMFVLAHHPLRQFRLSFGKQDMMRQYAAKLGGDLLPDDAPAIVAAHFRDTDIPNAINRKIQMFVSRRFLTPFFENQLKGLKDAQKNNAIERLANKAFVGDKPPLYRIDGESIVVHPKWADYVADNLQIICAWRELRWLNYLHRNNPNVPGIPDKLAAPPEGRKNMPDQRKFWQSIIAAHSVRCIYSGTDLSSVKNIVLDHYVPWNFYAHNHLWNLVPTTAAVNSAKSDSLPADKYYPKFLHIQHLAVRVLANSPGKWKKLRESYETGLADASGREEFDKLISRAYLKQRYDMVLYPAIQLAKARGFASGWKHREKLL